MPNRDVHLRAGGIAGAGYAAYHAWEFTRVQLLVETAGGAVDGAMGGVLPDAIDLPTSLALDSLTPSSLPILC